MSKTSDDGRLLQSLSNSISELVASCLPRTCTILVTSTDLSGSGNGSGWCYSERHVVTNHHVVDDAGGIVNVRFPGQKIKRGRVLGSDPLTDLAVIEVDACDVEPFEVRTNPPLRTGELCLTMGAPRGFEESVSLGIVSALHRQLIQGDIKFEEAIQTDAAVNPGNSGGPLLDAWGRVIGVNFLKLGTSPMPTTQISFAIPNEVVLDIVPELISHGAIVRASIGVSISQVATEVDGRSQSAVQIQKVRNNTPLQPGDLILECQGSAIHRRYDLMRLLNRSAIGTSLKMKVLREGAIISLEVPASA